MKKILVILDGIVAKNLMQRIVETNTGENYYDIIYVNDAIVPEQKLSNFTFYKFDPTSKSKLAMVLDKNIHYEVLIVLNSKDDMLSVISNIKSHKHNLQMNILDYWNLELEDPYVNVYKGIEVLANGMVERLPNIPVIAQNIGLKHGEIMEIRIPFGSSYAYRYIGSIEQKDWRIFALYRNEKLQDLKPSSILKPNDIILVIGEPKVLMQVYSAIGKTRGQFPMPFGHNIYLYLDLFLMKKSRIEKAVYEAKHLNTKLKNTKLVIRITRPTTVGIMDMIKSKFKDDDNVIIETDYHNLGFRRIKKMDFKKFDIGMIMLTGEMFKIKEISTELMELKIPLFKLGREPVGATKNTLILLNDTNSYEQISPIVFDVSSQLKTKTKVFDIDPIGEEDKSKLLDHFENLSKIFSQKIEVVSCEKNPIRELRKEENILQILPLKKSMFHKRFSWSFLYTNSDLLSFDMAKYNQLLIPVIED
ncbi:potassium transporter TrkA [Arcobacter sp. CECT 8986]|uniref:COG3400 family protein n=1 Tax=Arcobacter sp. CECT 8986 TaxID=2044507 RepID=UPI001009B827|nr:TrkA C-terminal domain-containing protein [Arcobacter sp. CECT 8986]RXJ98563.1 potassium transporter TrkA [Arcobacter sp. CECT 8986]